MVSLVTDNKVSSNRTFADNRDSQLDDLAAPAGVNNLVWQLSSPDERRALLANLNNGNTAGGGNTLGFNASPTETLEGANPGAISPFNTLTPSQLSLSDAGLGPAGGLPTEVLRSGSRGANVVTLQQLLTDAGFNPGPADGAFGPRTDAAVRSFQSANNLTVDGIVGPQTWNALANAGPVTPPSEGPRVSSSDAVIRNGARSEGVEVLQQQLAAEGFNPGPADGIFGGQTESAVRAFQSANNLTADGIVGPQTWDALGVIADTVQPPNDGPIIDGPVPATGDAVSDRRIAELHPEIQQRAAAFVNEVKQELGIQLRVTDGLRTFDEQNALYAQGRTAPGPIVTNAQGGRSYHNYGLAIDVVELRPDGSVDYGTDYEAIAEIGKQYGFEWGGDFTSITDKPHFQFTGGYSTRELLALSNNGANPYVDLD